MTKREKPAGKAILSPDQPKPCMAAMLSWPQTPAPTWQWVKSTACQRPSQACVINVKLSFCLHKQFHGMESSDKQISWDQGAHAKLERDHRGANQHMVPGLGAEINSMEYDRRMTNAAGAWLCHAMNAPRLRIM